jgi:hypothetical protein
MTKKIQGISLLLLLLVVIGFGLATPAFNPIDKDQPIRPLLRQDQALKQTYSAMMKDELSPQDRSEFLIHLSSSYLDLYEQTNSIKESGVEHALIDPLASYFVDLSKTFTRMATAFAETDPVQLAEANESFYKLDQIFLDLQKQQ